MNLNVCNFVKIVNCVIVGTTDLLQNVTGVKAAVVVSLRREAVVRPRFQVLWTCQDE